MIDSTSPRRTPLFDKHLALGGRMVAFAGFELPVQYVGLTKEHAAVRAAAGLFDVSHMGELWVVGPAAVPAVDRLVSNSLGKLPDGKAMYTLCCNPQGGILDDLLVYRVAQDRVLIVCNASNREKIVAHVGTQLSEAHAPEAARLDDRSDETTLLALQGPRAEAILANSGAPDSLTRLGRFQVAEGSISGMPALVARTGYTGEDGFELFVDNRHAEGLWELVMAAGQEHGLQPIGLGARDTLRLEAGLMLYGNDIDESCNPLEAGLGKFVKLKGDDFVGRDALVDIKAKSSSRRLVGIEMRGRGIARSGYPILDTQGQGIGRITSGGPGLTVGKNIALGYVPSSHREPGTDLSVEIRGKAVEAVVCTYPFYVRARS